MPLKRLAIPLALAAAAVLGAVVYLATTANDAEQVATGAALASVVVPAELSPRARHGRQAYEENCAVCHGTNAVGQEGVAPPLVHEIYRPGHHGDESFQRAVSMGVMAHHWPFGNMPRVEGLDRRDVALIVDYIRELQRANGID